MKKALAVLVILLCSLTAMAQRPKLHLKAFAGYNTHIFVYKEYEKSKDVIHGWQGGFGFRVTVKQIMAELDFHFLRNSVIVALPDSLVQGEFDKFEFKMNAFEMPLKIGVVPIKTPLYKWYCYTGAGFRFNTRGKLDISGEETTFKPKEVGLANPNIDFILGTQMDIAWLNVDLMYSLGVTNSIRENIRTNSHEIQINVGILF
jgi:hypothetical protein